MALNLVSISARSSPMDEPMPQTYIELGHEHFGGLRGAQEEEASLRMMLTGQHTIHAQVQNAIEIEVIFHDLEQKNSHGKDIRTWQRRVMTRIKRKIVHIHPTKT